jgi:outer membrane murein-binding lipoprotein Lpp
MSEETTQKLPDERSFEERVFARFDALDARMDRVESRLDDMNARLQKLESESEQRAVETKPIWERALAEIIAVGQKVDAVERKLNVLGLDMLTLRADQTRLESRMDKLDSEPAR